MVTAELAAAVPALLVVHVVGVSVVQLGVDEVRCVDAARLAARALARGDSEVSARDVAARAGPAGAGVSVAAFGSEITVTVSASRDLAGWRSVTVQGAATAQREEPAGEVPRG